MRLVACCQGVKSISTSELSLIPYLMVVSPRPSEVSRSPASFCTVQSASPVSSCQCPTGTVQAEVALPGRSAQIGAWSAAAAAPLAHSSAAAQILIDIPRIGFHCVRDPAPSSDKRELHTLLLRLPGT